MSGQSKGGIQQVESGGFRWRIMQDVGGKLVRASGPVVTTLQEAEAGLLKARKRLNPE